MAEFGNGHRGLIFIQSANPLDDPTSGSGICHRDWANVLQEEGFNVVVIESNNKENALADKVPYKIESIPFDGRKDNPQLKFDPEPYQNFKSAVPFNYLAFLAATRSSLQFVDVDEYTLQAYVYSFGWAFRSNALVYGVPDVAWNGHTWVQNYVSSSVPTAFTVHGTGVAPHSGGREKRYLPIIKEGMEGSFKAVAISDQENENILGLGMDPAKVEVIYNGYNDDVFRPDRGVTKTKLVERNTTNLDPNTNWVVFAGRAAHFKGLDNLIEAMPKVMEQVPDAHLIIIGSGDHSKIDVKGADPINHFKLVEDLGIKERVHFIGPLPQSEMADFISVADAYVLPSRNEPFGLVAIEGMAVGKPPILTLSGGFLSIVELFTGKDPREMDERVLDVARMVEAEDTSKPETRPVAIASLTEAVIAELKESPEEREHRSKKAVEFADENFSVHKVVGKKMIPLIEAAVKEGHRSDRWNLEFRDEENGPRRKTRLDAIEVDSEVAEAFSKLRNSIGTPGFGKAWREFDWAASRFFGKTKFLQPLDLDAMPAYRDDPNALFSELTRAAGVPIREMFRVMREVEETPWQELVITKG
jgi:glycosyltransferase involved in cell wall biosynthesis